MSVLTVAEVADRLRVTPATVRRLIRDGELGALRVGRQYRVPAAALDRLDPLASSARPGASTLGVPS